MAKILAKGGAKEVADRFRKQHEFRSDPVTWMEKKLGRVMWSKPKDIARSVVANKYTAVHACHGVGKSFTAADIVAWWIDVHPPGTAIVITTAPTWKQVKNILWKEIKRARTKGDLPGYVTEDAEWKVKVGRDTELVAFGRKPADHDEDGFQGIHEQYVLVIIDEACGVTGQIWTAIETLVTNDASRVLAIGNPDNPETRFFEVCKPASGWNVIRISAFDWLKERANFPTLWKHLTSPGWVEERKKRWGEKSPLYISKVLGLFPEESDDLLISPGMIQQAHLNDFPGRARGNYGLDVARFGSDETVCYRNRGGVVRFEWALRKSATTKTAGKMTAQLRKHVGTVPVVVDGVGLGGGVVDQLRENAQPVIEYNSSHAASDPKRFDNRRSEDYWTVREMFEAGEIDLDPEDDLLANQLMQIKWTLTGKGKIVVESKEDMKARLGKDALWSSPDRADAVVMALCGLKRKGKTVAIPLGGNSITQGIREKPM